ncbi:MAG: undecaprenyl/decaprenyl-phosphate alpha-N-acetylglucosaminyl 1-phosphate transferase [Saprospiraceae bacterium]|nr:undecaprenyl/decaprenyl-phosphate alpha-N-acetylglucosaminyl 1-phosphate transferase [Saprospiraceae bacterium]
MAIIILAFITSFSLTYLAIPSIIHLAEKKNLVDEPGDRRSHHVRTPSLGGIAIFAGMLFSIIMWTPFNYFGDLQYILCAFIIIFLIGARDDIDPISPTKKLAGEMLAAAILVFKANIKITSLYGIFGIYELNMPASVLLSIFTIIVIINAFNLIDGINGLSGSIALLISLVLGTWFFQIQRLEIAIVAFALSGSIVAFLKFNITPAKIFMGDTGALLLGLVCSILAILFIELHKDLINSPYKFDAAPSLAIATLILPLFDTLRVFTLRLLRKKSPFFPDRSHIHHILIDIGLTHMQATGILIVVNILFILLAFSLQHIGNLYLLITLFIIAVSLSFFLSRFSSRKKAVNS